eukprot:3167797-Alexandrium_andersonii.AAC.1
MTNWLNWARKFVYNHESRSVKRMTGMSLTSSSGLGRFSGCRSGFAPSAVLAGKVSEHTAC